MSNFDTLLDLDPPAGNGSAQTGNGPSLDPFDPFGPSPTLDSKGGNDLLLNYEVSVQNGTNAENGAGNVDLLGEFESGQSSNPMYNLRDDDDDNENPEDLAALIKQQAASDPEVNVTETITTTDDGQTTVVTTRRSRSYDSDRECSPEVKQVVEEMTTSTDDGMTIKKVTTTTTTTEGEYYDDNSGEERPFQDQFYDEKLEEQSYNEQPSVEQSYEEQPSVEQSYEEQASVEQSYEEQPSIEQSYEEEASNEQSYDEQPSAEEPLQEERPSDNSEEQVSYDDQPSFEENPSFVELPSAEESQEEARWRRSQTPSPSFSDSEPQEIQVNDKQEEEIIKNGATFYRTKDEQHYSEQRKSDEFGNEQQETSRSVKEEVTPGQLRSPFFGDAPLQQNGVDDEVERDPNILRETRNKETIQFSELSNFKNKFETGVESQKVSTVSPDELDQVRQSAAAGSLRNKFESVAKGDQNSQKERKPMREITPPSEGTRVVYETEVTRNPDVVRADDVVDEGIYMPKPGASKEIWEKFQTGKIKDNAPRQRTSVIDEIQSVEGGVFENEPQINPDVVRSGEGDAFADLPSTGSTRDVLSKFKQMESGAGYVPTPKGVREITPPPSGKVEYVSEPTRRVEKYVGKAESGVFESQPDIRPDVVRSGQQLEEDNQLPQQGFTKSAAALFRQKEAEAGRVKTASTGGLRQITPPRDASVVYESQPERLPDVVRAEDRMDDDGLPHQGAARNMLAKFKQMESSGHQSSGAPRQMKAFTPPRDGGVFENNPEKFVPDYDRKAEGGVFENQPQHRDDVVRAADHFEEELPERGMARNMVARFRQLSESTKSQSPVSPKSPHDRSFKEFTPPREEPRSPKGVLPTDMPEQYQQSSGGVSENIPQHRADVVREADTDYEAGMPAPSTTKHLLARFQTIQHEAKAKEQPKPLRKEAPQLYSATAPSPKMPASAKEGGPARFRAVQAEKCAACQKTVYAMEKMEFNKNVYHKTCFKCSHCKNRLTPATFSVNQGILYCLNHFKQMFKTKGNYDEGFGREQYKKKWKSEPNIAGLAEEEHSSPRS
ncbi:pharyngeal muscle protein 2-like isoform X6 [Liolophura sinensis]|uniref:pharyngeal muscle protein 2-like isoform X6 n=1 Tax=Liolophura sinensis TaxID=3198878 RepID=UPI0031589120